MFLESQNPDAPDTHLLLSASGDPTYKLMRGEREVSDVYPCPVMGSPSGVAWGYLGSGPHRLATFILSQHFPLDPQAPRTEQDIWHSLGYPQDNDAQAEAANAQIESLPQHAQDELYRKFDAAYEALPGKVSSGEFLSRRVLALAQKFKEEMIAPLDIDKPHIITAQAVREWLTRQGTLN